MGNGAAEGPVTSPIMVAILAAILDFFINQVKTERNGGFCA